MPQNQYIIPRPNKQFDSYINATTHYLQLETPPNWQRLGLTPEELTGWIDLCERWKQEYARYTSKLTRTSVVTQEKNLIKAAFIAYATPLLLKIAGNSALITADRLNFRLYERDTTLTKRGKILDIPMVGMHPTGGGRVKIHVRRTTDNNRASRHPLADAVEMKFSLAPIDAPPPASADQCTNNYISTKAAFIYDAGQAGVGKRLFAFFRWINLRNQQNNGGWTNVIRTAIA